jgi:3-oxoacyl-[acyl-carrier protein] reductase
VTRRAALITGASRGLGREIALRFGRAGWNVAVNCAHSVDAAETVVEELIGAGVDAFSAPADVADRSAHQKLIDSVIARWSRIDCLVNNAAVPQNGPTPRLADAEWDGVIATDLLGPMRLARCAAEVMQPGSTIVNVISICGLWGCAGSAAYSAAKGALAGFSQGAARELAERGVRINAVAPGYMATDMGNATPGARDAAVRQHAMGVLSDPRAAAEFILALTQMPAVTGQVFNLDGRIRSM